MSDGRDKNRFGKVVYRLEDGVEVPYIEFRTKKEGAIKSIRLDKKRTYECEIAKLSRFWIPNRRRTYHRGQISVMPNQEKASQNGSKKKLNLRVYLYCKELYPDWIDFKDLRMNLYVYLLEPPQEENRD